MSAAQEDADQPMPTAPAPAANVAPQGVPGMRVQSLGPGWIRPKEVPASQPGVVHMLLDGQGNVIGGRIC